MARKRCTTEEVTGQLRAIEIALGEGLPVVEACRKLGIMEQTYYRSETLLSFFFKGQSQSRMEVLCRISAWYLSNNEICL